LEKRKRANKTGRGASAIIANQRRKGGVAIKATRGSVGSRRKSNPATGAGKKEGNSEKGS